MVIAEVCHVASGTMGQLGWEHTEAVGTEDREATERGGIDQERVSTMTI